MLVMPKKVFVTVRGGCAYIMEDTLPVAHGLYGLSIKRE
jgi:hypothetical protein